MLTTASNFTLQLLVQEALSESLAQTGSSVGVARQTAWLQILALQLAVHVSSIQV